LQITDKNQGRATGLKRRTIMAKKTSIYLPTIAQEIIASYGPGVSVSGTITTIIECFREICVESAPELTEGEWLAIADARHGGQAWMSDEGIDPSLMVWARLLELKGFDEKLYRPLEAKIKKLTRAGRIACWDVVCRFWAALPEHEELNEFESLIACGAKIKKEN